MLSSLFSKNKEIKEEGSEVENKQAGKSLEVSFKFPKVETAVISKMSVTIGEKTVDAKIMEKKEAK